MEIRLRYKLEYEDAYNAFYETFFPYGRRIHRLITATTIAVVLVLLYFQYKTPGALFYPIISCFGIIILYMLICRPVLRARKAASAVESAGGGYDIIVYEDGALIVNTAKGQIFLHSSKDKNSRFIETDQYFIAKMNAGAVICIPKCIMDDSKQEEIRRRLITATKKYTYRKTKEDHE